MDSQITYQALVERYGEKMANELLLVLERSASIKSNFMPQDKEGRMKNVIDTLQQANAAN